MTATDIIIALILGAMTGIGWRKLSTTPDTEQNTQLAWATVMVAPAIGLGIYLSL